MTYRPSHSLHPMLQVKTGLPVQVVLGSPKRKCAGLGICKIDKMDVITTAFIEAECGIVAGLLTVKDQQLILYVLKYSISDCTRAKHFANNHIELESEYDLPPSLCESLGIAGQAQVPAGQYSMTDLGSHLCISMRLAEKDICSS